MTPTYLHRLEHIHSRMPGVALLALVPGLTRRTLFADDAIETLHRKKRGFKCFFFFTNIKFV